MKKYSIMLALALALGSANVYGADFGDLLARLNSRDFSAERDVVTGKGGVYVGELVNPHSETPMFKARDEYRQMIFDAQQAKDAAKIADLCAFAVDALKADVSDETKAWLLEQLGVIGTDAQVPAIAECLKSDKQRVVDAAAASLAKIPGDAALKALEAAKDIPAVAAALTCRKAPIFDFESVEPSWPAAVSKASDADVEKWLAKYDELDDWTKEQTLAGLTARNDKKYRSYALKALKSDNAGLQRAGFVALEKMATAEDAAVFVEWLKKDRGLATRLAGFVVADGFDEALLACLDKAADDQEFGDLATILSNRAVDVRPAIFAKTTAAECPDRLALMQRVCKLATTDDMPKLLESVARFPRGKDRDAASNLVAALCAKDATSVLALADKMSPAFVYPIAARVGGDAAKAAIEKALDSNDPNMRAVGLAALNVWADGQFAAKMEEILNSNAFAPQQKIAVLRAYIRVISLPDDQIGIKISREEKLAKLKVAYKGATRADEKKLVLSRLAANRYEDSFKFAIECAETADAAVLEAAYEAVVAHAHDTILRKQFPELAEKGLNIVIEKSKNKDLVERAKTYKGRME
ncbi:MAG: HEAT repeat domain-containing protein [Thermoguttaceae bacterium]|nr:HEAT repeat domain-containing protein [Thermoguttaceae bacterium]